MQTCCCSHAVVLVLSIACVSSLYPFQDPTLPWSERVDDLVSRLTLEEVANQSVTTYTESDYYSAVPRLGIKPYVWISECIGGQRSTNTTAFPLSIGQAASWSKELLYNMSNAISYEVRAHWNGNTKIGKYQTYYGLSCFSPVINIARHPLWGRIQETYGECPYLTGSLAQHYVKGLQGDNQRYVRVSTGCKHLDVYGGPENIPSSRLSFDAKVSTRDMRMTFLPAFKKCVEAGTYNMVCSYNRINGVPACANGELLTNITRKEWGFTGYISSDASAIAYLKDYHHYTKTDEESVTKAIKAGCNLNLGQGTYLKQLSALKKGMLTEKELRDNVKPMFYTRMRLGLFDPPSMNPYSGIDMSVVQSPEHRALAVKVAQMSFTLLKNNGVLPLTGNVKILSIVGPFGNETEQLYGKYSSNVVPLFTTTVLQGLSRLATEKTNFARGCDNTNCVHYDKEGQSDIQNAVNNSDLVVVALGTGQAVESEENDRAYLDLPGKQLDLLKDAVYHAPQDTPVIVLLFNAGPLDVTWAKLNDRVGAIMACYFSAQSTGEALYNTLTASTPDAIPAGRLPVTWPADISQVPEMTDYTMEGRTYRYYNGDPLYPFGYGLSYTTFTYSDLSVSPKTIKAGQNVTVKVTVRNTGRYGADEVVQVYMSWPKSSPVPVPKLQLVGYSRERIVAGQLTSVTFTITGQQMAVWMDDTTGWGYVKGEMQVYVGGQQPGQRTQVPSNVLTASFMLNSSAQV